MRGSPRNQIGSICKVSHIFERGSSKFAAQTAARHHGASGSHRVAQTTGLYGDNTYSSYRAVWTSFAEYARNELGVKDLEKTKVTDVRAYLEQRIEQGVMRSTWDKEASAMNKFAVALNRVSDNLGRGVRYDFTAAIDSVRPFAKAELNENSESRAYHDPARIIASIHDDKSQIAASLQHQGGARISEIEQLKEQQFLGYATDRVTGEAVGRIYLDNCKGGQDRVIEVDPATYDRAIAIAREEGIFQFDQNGYRADLREACAQAGEQYNGSHGLRWNFAQDRVEELQEHGLNFDQSLRETSEDMGHHRAEITRHYLR